MKISEKTLKKRDKEIEDLDICFRILNSNLYALKREHFKVDNLLKVSFGIQSASFQSQPHSR
jgi:hypothetical protein